MSDQFIYETDIPYQVCEQLVDFYYNNDSFNPKEGIVGNRDGVDLDVKESLDICVPLSYAKYDKRISNYLYHLDRCIKCYYNKFEQSSMPSKISDKFNIQKYSPGGGYKVWHHERTNTKHTIKRHLVWMTYLSNNLDGGTEFLYQDMYVPAEIGKTLIWPADWTYTHRSKIDTSKEKIIVTGWIELK